MNSAALLPLEWGFFLIIVIMGYQEKEWELFSKLLYNYFT
jgi:hypothetical protein